MESRLKLKISRMFRSSFESCRNRNVSDVIETPVFIPENRCEIQKIETLLPPKPKVRPFPSMYRPKLQESMAIQHEDRIGAKGVSSQRKKITERGVCLVMGTETEGRACPPASPCSPSNFQPVRLQDIETKEKKKKSKKVKKPMMKNQRKERLRFSSSSGDSNNGWFTSEEETEDETETFFSSKSFSSDSSESQRRQRKNSRRKLAEARRKKALKKGYPDMGLCSCMKTGKVEESFAIVKRSSDPHSDFRTSMVEMILEKQIFSAKDLEKLLQCFISLNSPHHHKVIVEVFTEIWDALFSNWS